MTATQPSRLTSPSREQDGGTRDRYFSKLAQERPDIAMCRATTLVARTIDEELSGHRLTVAQHLVLKMLDDVGPCSQQELSEQLRIDRSVMVGCIDGLEDSGLVRRERHPRDRRAYAVTLTPEAGPALAEAEGGVPRLLDRAFGALTAAERRTLARLVGKILEVN
ncbi:MULTISPECIES: MarR family winged helix-turn-helix transcriptional regulator [Streptomyces]|uniref:MarR family winged helix-turn-helix transcriptional regulator n=1 Tax=Streptomyces TaxID=1883 RepID=UPI00080B7505|nr:MarR family transcriptional regulator [Streptomyces sp. PTY087I2]NED04462.1 MarR family transcriptional regulator [Streptomyces sp. SID6648]OCC11917.1 Multidrug resistance operon repressor [Streptomyces sp. PTY087I2]